MAYDGDYMTLTGSHNGFGTYRYDTLDALTDVDGSGYFNNSDDDLNLAVGDIIDVVVWSTAVRTGTIADVGKVIVVSVSAAGVVDCSNDLLGATVIDSD
jgi:hypothetical protein